MRRGWGARTARGGLRGFLRSNACAHPAPPRSAAVGGAGVQVDRAAQGRHRHGTLVSGWMRSSSLTPPFPFLSPPFPQLVLGSAPAHRLAGFASLSYTPFDAQLKRTEGSVRVTASGEEWRSTKGARGLRFSCPELCDGPSPARALTPRQKVRRTSCPPCWRATTPPGRARPSQSWWRTWRRAASGRWPWRGPGPALGRRGRRSGFSHFSTRRGRIPRTRFTGPSCTASRSRWRALSSLDTMRESPGPQGAAPKNRSGAQQPTVGQPPLRPPALADAGPDPRTR